MTLRLSKRWFLSVAVSRELWFNKIQAGRMTYLASIGWYAVDSEETGRGVVLSLILLGLSVRLARAD
jgi:hypothetical protein